MTGTPDSGLPGCLGLAFSDTLRLVLMTATVRVFVPGNFSASTCRYSTLGITILKLRCAVALNALPGDAVSRLDSGTAMSGSSNAVPLIKPLNAQCHFTMSSRVALGLSRLSEDIDKRRGYFNDYLWDFPNWAQLGLPT